MDLLSKQMVATGVEEHCPMSPEFGLHDQVGNNVT